MSAKLPFTQDLLWISSQNLQHVSRTRYRSQPRQRLELVLDWSLNDPNRLIPPMLWEYASQWWNGCIHRLQLLAVLAALLLLQQALVGEDGGDPVLGHGSEEYVGPAHICARGKLRHLNLQGKT